MVMSQILYRKHGKKLNFSFLFLASKKLSMCILVEKWIKEGDQERLKWKEKEVVLTRQIEAHGHPGKNIKGLR